MCETCGCGEPVVYQIRLAGQNEPFDIEVKQSHEHSHSEKNSHNPHHHDHPHDFPSAVHEHDHVPDHDINTSEFATGNRLINLGKNILESNNLMAERNRGFFMGKNIFCINLVSSPGSGKTTLLEKVIKVLKEKIPVYVIEGDQQTMLDGDRIAKLGIPVVQINTGSGCHLDAHMINKAMKSFNLSNGSLLFIENVGNLVCPALFDLGESKRVIVMSVTEGDDKPLKYPAMFRSAHLCLINKSDLLPYVDFRVEFAKKSACAMNPALEFLELSAKTGDGLEPLIQWIIRKVNSPGN